MALIKWLKSGGDKKPVRVSSAASENAASAALVQASFKTGTIFLRGPEGDIGLDWKNSDKQRGRALPPGHYQLRTVRIERTDGEDHWFVSISGQHGRKYKLRQGASKKIVVSSDVNFRAHARRHGQNLRLGFGITDASKRGLSIYKNDSRVAVTYKLLSKKGKVLNTGKMNYG